MRISDLYSSISVTSLHSAPTKPQQKTAFRPRINVEMAKKKLDISGLTTLLDAISIRTWSTYPRTIVETLKGGIEGVGFKCSKRVSSRYRLPSETVTCRMNDESSRRDSVSRIVILVQYICIYILCGKENRLYWGFYPRNTEYSYLLHHFNVHELNLPQPIKCPINNRCSLEPKHKRAANAKFRQPDIILR